MGETFHRATNVGRPGDFFEALNSRSFMLGPHPLQTAPKKFENGLLSVFLCVCF